MFKNVIQHKIKKHFLKKLLFKKMVLSSFLLKTFWVEWKESECDEKKMFFLFLSQNGKNVESVVGFWNLGFQIF